MRKTEDAVAGLKLQSQDGMNPELAQRLQMDVELRHQNPINQLQSQYEQLIQIAESQQIDIMRSINPIDDIEGWLGRSIEYLYMERELVREYLNNNGKIPTSDALKEQYESRLIKIRTDFIEGFKERLKSRDWMFDKDQFFKLDDAKRELKLQEFIKEVEIKLAKYQLNFLSKVDNDIVTYALELNDLLEEKQRYLAQLIEKKTPLAEKYLDIDKRLAKLQSDSHKAILGQREALDNTLPSLCYKGEIEKVKKMLQENPKLINRSNSVGELPLHRACEAGHTHIAIYLFSEGAQPSVLDETKNQLSAYHYACISGDTNILEAFYKKVGNELFKILGRSNRTLLHSTVFANQRLVLEWLIDKNVFNKKLIDVNAKDTFLGFTALHIAAWLGYPQITQRLLELGANIEIKNNVGEGERPLLTALFNRRAEILVVFLEHGYSLKPTEINVAFNYVKVGDNRRPENNRLFAQTIHAANRRFQAWYHDPLFKSPEKKELHLQAIETIYKLKQLSPKVVEDLSNALKAQENVPKKELPVMPIEPSTLKLQPTISTSGSHIPPEGLVLPSSWMGGPLNSTGSDNPLPELPTQQTTEQLKKEERTGLQQNKSKP